MKPRTDLIVNVACLFVLSPLLGMMVTGMVVGVLEALMWTVAAVGGLVSAIFFDVDFTAIQSRIPIVRQIEKWLIFGCGTIGGIIWSVSKIRAKWKRHKIDGRGW